MRDSADGLGLIRHDAAHVLAEAVQELWPTTQVTIGPVIENGFYYDFYREAPFSEDDLRADRKEDGRDRQPRRRLHQGSVGPRRDQARLRGQGRELQGRAGRRHPGRPEDQDLQAGPVVRPLPRPAHALDQGRRHRLQADQGGRRLLARRQQPRGAEPHLRHRVRDAEGARRVPPHAGGGREARPSQDRPRARPLPPAGRGAGLGVLAPQGLRHLQPDGGVHPPPGEHGRLRRGEDPAADVVEVLGGLGPLGQVPREHVRGARRGARHRGRRSGAHAARATSWRSSR